MDKIRALARLEVTKLEFELQRKKRRWQVKVKLDYKARLGEPAIQGGPVLEEHHDVIAPTTYKSEKRALGFCEQTARNFKVKDYEVIWIKQRPWGKVIDLRRSKFITGGKKNDGLQASQGVPEAPDRGR